MYYKLLSSGLLIVVSILMIIVEQPLLAQQELNTELGVFREIGNSLSLLKKFYSIVKLQLQGVSYGSTRDGIELTLNDIIESLKNISRSKREEFMTVLINFIVMNVPVGSDNELLLKIKEIREKGTNRYADLVTYLLNSITEDNILKYIRELLVQFLKQNNPLDYKWKFENYVPDPTEEEKKDDTTIKKDEGQGETIEDTTFLTLTDDLNNQQRDTLINIITTLSQNENLDITDEEFIKNVIFIFTNLKAIVVSNDTTSTRTSSSTSTEPPSVRPSSSSLLTDILNKIRENSSLLIEIGNLILNPSPKLVATKITEILNSLKTTSIEPDAIIKPDTVMEPVSQNTLSSGDSFFTEITEEQNRNYFLEAKYADQEDDKTSKDYYQKIVAKGLKNIQNIYEEYGIEIETYGSVDNSLVEEVKTFEEVKIEDDEDIKIITEQIKQINKNNKSNIIKKKLQSVMNELRKKFGKIALRKVFVIKRDNQPDLTFNSHYQLGQWLVANDTTVELTPVIVKYGLVRDYISEDDQQENEFRYGPPDGGPPDGGPPDGGGDPSGGRGYRRQGPSRRPRGRVTNSLTKRQYLLLVLIIALLATGAVSLEEVFKAGKDLNDNGTTTKPPPIDPTKPDIPVGPTKPDGTFNKISHNDFWDSVGLGTVIDTYNNMVDKYNALPAIEKKAYKSTVELYYDKFAKTINIPTLSELKQARARYDALKKIYDSSDGLSFDQVSNIYTELNKSMNYLNKMTDKYLSFENKAFGITKNKDDADVTIDDVDANINLITKINTSLSVGKNKAIVNSSYAVLSKGMRERIARKLKGDGDFSSGLIQENKRFIDFSLVKPQEYPSGLGLDNPLVYRNKEYEIMQHKNNYVNPQPYKVPSMNKLINISKQDKPILNNVIQLDNSFNYNSGNTLISQKLQNPNEMPTQFIKSRLFNPEYHLEQINKQQKANNTMNDEIRCGSYVGIKDNQYYQYANIQKKQNDKLNNYPMTKEFKITQPILPKKTIKNSRNVPNSYALK